ncbi:bis-aminopropyl spermidine synthase family protein [Nodosilinea sp. PGN35]|uniref:bis-aminopropyl spermidine synthase family protein n=1 Tax=Nodosilinea sp. PGN35 TaxID=3020489 RepID=UPI0023B2A68C|nr:bis-aminopropyl spermidine synthase family protein [Nodosilinea sp. TSF1-S3]MDF0367243.1 bis-aminopropyl spermidine synthase family protein [Nodosilinea sp. TSF1-S3]
MVERSIRRLPVGVGLLGLLLGLIVTVAHGAAIAQLSPDPTYRVGETFTLEATTRLRGRTGEYRGYREEERDRRTYTITNVAGNVVSWRVTSDFRYSDSDGGGMAERYVFDVQTDATTRAYLNGTYDSPEIGRDYYTFDYIWFRIDPTAAGIETRHQILGNTFVVQGPRTARLGPLRAVESLHLALEQPYSRTVANTEYDPTGQWQLDVGDETYDYDPATGYLVRADWRATGRTSVGQFDWAEEIVLQDSSFPLSVNLGATAAGLVAPVGLGGGAIALLISYLPFQSWRWRRQVDTLLQALAPGGSGLVAEAAARRALSAWNPMALRYTDLLDPDALGELASGDYLELRSGVYIINDLNNRLGIVDTHADDYLPTQILPTQLDNLRLLYRLALGVTPGQVVEAAALGEGGLNLASYAVRSRGFAQPDAHGVEVYSAHRGSAPADPSYQDTIQLLARRRVLDYTLGQAPLSPQSHLKKVESILRDRPREVLLVGDDDLVSVALARRGIQATVLEVDPYTCALIQGIAQQENLPIALWQHDLRRALPPELDDPSRRFDLFVTDSDFTLESFFLFLNRGLSLLRVGGTGLINFEHRRAQRYRARHLLQQLQVAVLEEDRERWRYVILRNTKSGASGFYTGKYMAVNYREGDIGLAEASYGSVLFRIRRTIQTQVPLRARDDFGGGDRSIYDY